MPKIATTQRGQEMNFQGMGLANVTLHNSRPPDDTKEKYNFR